MNSLALYDRVCLKASRNTTAAYRKSFSIGLRSLHERFRDTTHAIYGFVRFTDGIVDTFHTHDKRTLLVRFREDTERAISEGIHMNPILHSYQGVVRRYGIERASFEAFLRSMEMDLHDKVLDQRSYEAYVLGSAEVVRLMCLRVFCEGDEVMYQCLKPAVMKLGSAVQKVNFLRDIKDDHRRLGRTYFPGVNVDRMSAADKRGIGKDIQAVFWAALTGIKQLPKGARFGVYVAYAYYTALFRKIRALPTERVLQERIRIPTRSKIAVFTTSFARHSFGML